MVKHFAGTPISILHAAGLCTEKLDIPSPRSLFRGEV